MMLSQKAFVIQPYSRGGSLLFKLCLCGKCKGEPGNDTPPRGTRCFLSSLPSSVPPCPICVVAPLSPPLDASSSSGSQNIASLCTPHTPLPYFLSSLCNSSAFMLLPSIQFAPILSIPLCTLRPLQLSPVVGRELGVWRGVGGAVWLVRVPLVMLDERH